MPNSFNKKIVGKNFSQAAKSYEEEASTQKLAAEKLCQLTLPFVKDGARILDLGSGTGFVANNFRKQKSDLRIFESDLSLEMLRLTQSTEKIQCDFENLPFKNQSFDILVSSFSLQWLSDFEKNFAQFSSLLKPNGIFAFCLPCDKSLAELKIASAESGCNFHFNILPKIADLKSALKKCSFEEKSFQQEMIKSEFNSGAQALKSIKSTGANYFAGKNFVSKTQLKQFNNFCLKNFCSDTKKISISWDISLFVSQKN